MRKNDEHDILIVGDGVAGLALAYGLALKGRRVAVLGRASPANNASLTNVGLIWVQSKFLHRPEYARWGFMSSRLYPGFVKELQEITELPVPMRHSGGIIPCLGEEECAKRARYFDDLRKVLDFDPGMVIGRSELERKLPGIPFGPEVAGAAWCEEDGLIDPLALVHALRNALPKLNVPILPGLAYGVTPEKGGYSVDSSLGVLRCERLVLAAGLANRRLSQFALPVLPVFPDKGQVLLVERLPQVMPYPILGITQTFAGSVVVGFRHENVGHDRRVLPPVVSEEGRWAMRVWPELGRCKVTRSWCGLRVMPDDNVAIYSRLPGHPTAFLVNTHSAVTMAAAHVRLLPDFLCGGELPETARDMTLARFGIAC